MTHKTILLVASRWDTVAKTLVERWASYGSCLVTPEDLSVAGWSHCIGDNETSVAIVGGRSLTASDIRGLITRLPYVYEQELDYIMPADRAYVAAEMNVFLLAWLARLPCPMLNRPTPSCLWGPAWRHEKWVHTIARLGIPVATSRRGSRISVEQKPKGNSHPESVPVTIIGQQHIGDVDPRLATTSAPCVYTLMHKLTPSLVR